MLRARGGIALLEYKPFLTQAFVNNHLSFYWKIKYSYYSFSEEHEKKEKNNFWLELISILFNRWNEESSHFI